MLSANFRVDRAKCCFYGHYNHFASADESVKNTEGSYNGKTKGLT